MCSYQGIKPPGLIFAWSVDAYRHCLKTSKKSLDLKSKIKVLTWWFIPPNPCPIPHIASHCYIQDGVFLALCPKSDTPKPDPMSG